MQIQLARVKTTPYLVIVGAGEINSCFWENTFCRASGMSKKQISVTTSRELLEGRFLNNEKLPHC